MTTSSSIFGADLERPAPIGDRITMTEHPSQVRQRHLLLFTERGTARDAAQTALSLTRAFQSSTEAGAPSRNSSKNMPTVRARAPLEASRRWCGCHLRALLETRWMNGGRRQSADSTARFIKAAKARSSFEPEIVPAVLVAKAAHSRTTRRLPQDRRNPVSATQGPRSSAGRSSRCSVEDGPVQECAWLPAMTPS